jgi:sulfate adenylyltransferase subunit 1
MSGRLDVWTSGRPGLDLRIPGYPGAAPCLASNVSRTSMELLRFTTAGSVDDGKSTLIGRLMYDSKSIFEDQLEAVEETSAQRGDEHVNLALLTDGLRAERSRASRSTSPTATSPPQAQVHHRRHPGPHPVHPQHGHRRLHRQPRHHPRRCPQGVIEQTCRHSFIANLLRIQHVVVCGQQDGPRRLLRGGLR